MNKFPLYSKWRKKIIRRNVVLVVSVCLAILISASIEYDAISFTGALAIIVVASAATFGISYTETEEYQYQEAKLRFEKEQKLKEHE